MGLPWIQVRTNIRTHPKSVRLGIRLKDPRAYRLIVDLLLWCGDTAPDGRIRGPDAELVLEAGAGWDGEPGRFAAAAVDVGFVDRDGADLIVHDWEDHNGAHAAKLERDRARQKDKRRASRRPGDEVAGESRDGRATVAGERRGEERIKEEPPSEGDAPPAPASVAASRPSAPDAPVASQAARSASNDAPPESEAQPAPVATPTPSRAHAQLGLPGVVDDSEPETGTLEAPAPALAAKQASAQPAKPRKPSAWETLREDLRARRARALLGVLPDVELKPQALNATLARLTAEATAQHAVALVDAYEAFLRDSHARGCDPPCPLTLFVAQWSKYASAAKRTTPAIPQREPDPPTEGTPLPVVDLWGRVLVRLRSQVSDYGFTWLRSVESAEARGDRLALKVDPDKAPYIREHYEAAICAAAAAELSTAVVGLEVAP